MSDAAFSFAVPALARRELPSTLSSERFRIHRRAHAFTYDPRKTSLSRQLPPSRPNSLRGGALRRCLRARESSANNFKRLNTPAGGAAGARSTCSFQVILNNDDARTAKRRGKNKRRDARAARLALCSRSDYARSPPRSIGVRDTRSVCPRNRSSRARTTVVPNFATGVIPRATPASRHRRRRCHDQTSSARSLYSRLRWCVTALSLSLPPDTQRAS